MLHTLRQRLIFSHMLPLLVVVPLMGVALIYTLEKEVLLDNLSRELEAQAVLLTEVADDYTSIWYDPFLAQVFVDRFSPSLTARVMLLTPDGRLLATNEPLDARQLGTPAEFSGWAHVQEGTVIVHTVYSRQQHTEVIQVLVPVVGRRGEILGVVRLSRELTTIYEWFLRLRHVIAGVLAVALALGIIAASSLALNIERPLLQVTQAIQQLAGGRKLTPIAEQGPDQVRLLVRAFNSLVERLRSLEQARQQLLANLVHELRRPLGALYSAVEALRGGAEEEPELRQELLTGIEGEVERLQRLLADLAGLHDQVLGTLELDYRSITLSTWLGHVLAPWCKAAEEKNLHWSTHLPTDLPDLEADPDRLAQVVGNLLSNAIKFTPRGGSISVQAGTTGDKVWILVADSGPGIAAEDQDRIFSPFYRGGKNTRFPQGMGLGLTIARDLVMAHGGRLDVDSHPGQGSRFTIYLPLTAHGL
jgi:two-component system sensor histidine kinase BaeS